MSGFINIDWLQIEVLAKVNQLALNNTALSPEYLFDSSIGINSVMVNFMQPFDRATRGQIFSQTLIWVFLWRFFFGGGWD